jgi:hypothetical protein
MVLKLVYEAVPARTASRPSGTVDSLDVVATLMHFRGTVHDLAQLDLAYAPPFGSAKDPLHMAAFAAENDLDGLAPVVQPDADLSAFQVVDVRDAHEVAALPLAYAPHARHIPLDELRDRLDEFDLSDRPSSRVVPGSGRTSACGSSLSTASQVSTFRSRPRCGNSR